MGCKQCENLKNKMCTVDVPDKLYKWCVRGGGVKFEDISKNLQDELILEGYAKGA